MSIWDRHEHGVLEFSGGKDSLACMYLLRPYWDRITIVWCNTGDAFPETIQQMAHIRRIVPNFLEVKSDQPAYISMHGWPTDILPLTRTPFGRYVDGHELPIYLPYQACCSHNIWSPLQDTIHQLGIQLVIRGTRRTDRRKSHVRDGAVIDGIEYHHPIEDWSDDQVFDYLTRAGIEIPAYYSEVKSSLDCQHCTAFLHEAADKLRYMSRYHPDLHDEMVSRFRDIRQAIRRELDYFDVALGHDP